MMKHALLLSLCAALIWAGPAGADATQDCLSGRAKAAGKYQKCVQKLLSKHYAGIAFDDRWMNKASKCREKYFDAWATLVTLGVPPCSGSRWVDNGDGTVTDNLTDIVWEQKKNDSSIHDRNNLYTWSASVGGEDENGTLFTTFLATLNAGGGFAGSNGWRVPTLAELLTILNQPYLCPSGPCVDPIFGLGAMAPFDFATLTTHAGDPLYAWGIFFTYGGLAYGPKSLQSHAFAVRGGS